MAFVEPLGAFFDASQGFAVTALYNGAVEILVIFDNAWLQDTPGQSGIGSAQPMAMVEQSKIPNAARGDTLVIGPTTYTVAEVHPDGTGIVMLLLNK